MKNQGSVQKFFRVYIPNVTEDDMNLPFVSDEISRTRLPWNVTVKSISSGNIWRMEMTKNRENESVFLRHGWKKIVKDENLNEQTFLVFEFDGSCVFHFCVYKHSSMCKLMRSQVEKEEVESEESDEESTKGFYESYSRIKEKGFRSKRTSYLKTDSEKFKEYLDDKLNPSFLVNMNYNRTLIPTILIKDYNLRFPKLVTVCDKIGKLQRKISVWNNKSVLLNGIGSIIRRNYMKPGDKMVCELKMVDGYNGLVGEIKIHIIRDC